MPFKSCRSLKYADPVGSGKCEQITELRNKVDRGGVFNSVGDY